MALLDDVEQLRMGYVDDDEENVNEKRVCDDDDDVHDDDDDEEGTRYAPLDVLLGTLPRIRPKNWYRDSNEVSGARASVTPNREVRPSPYRRHGAGRVHDTLFPSQSCVHVCFIPLSCLIHFLGGFPCPYLRYLGRGPCCIRGLRRVGLTSGGSVC